MHELWFGIVALMLTAYVVLDGFDLGAGALHLWVARDDRERRTVLAAIGPFWDANEVWLLAAGGALFLAFPRALAAGLSGFYLAIFMVLWCLILRGVAIEFRSHITEPLWRRFWDTVFAFASALLPVLLGAALGNVIRGVPLTRDGWFQLTLFTSFLPRDPVGILDWFTVVSGVFALVALAGHGALFLAWKTAGPVGDRAVAARDARHRRGEPGAARGASPPGLGAGRAAARGVRDGRRVHGRRPRPRARRIRVVGRVPHRHAGRDGGVSRSGDAALER
jgi:cytochrome bd ubiquinol oxidase subunit II